MDAELAQFRSVINNAELPGGNVNSKLLVHWSKMGVWLVALIAVLSSTVAWSQVAPTGTVSGRVGDQSGAALPKAKVTIVNQEQNTTRTALTAEDGTYHFQALPVGHYNVTAEAPGFKTVHQTNLNLNVGQEAVMSFTLAVGAITEQVEVSVDTAQVDTTSSSLGHIVDDKQIANLPLNGRNFIDLTMLQTGITQFANNHFGTNALFGEFFSSNGAPLRSNMYTLDGAIMGNINGASASSISGESLGIDGISEYRTMTNSYSAEYGLVMGSQTTIVTKSGSNRFHGDAFEYLRNNVLDARNYFDVLYTLPASTPGGGRRIAPFKRNQFGGALGGPIKKDRLFFFGTYEGFRQVYDNPPNVGLATTLPAGCHTPVVNGVQTVDSSCDSTLKPGQTESVAPAIQPILALWPLPNIEPGDGFGYLSSNRVNENYAQGRIDYTMSTKDSLFGRYTYDNTNDIYPSIWPQYNYDLLEKQQYATVAERHIFSPNLVNSGAVSLSRSNVRDVTSDSNLIGPNYSCIPGAPLCPVTVSGVGNFTNGSIKAIASIQTIITGGDDAFWTKGKHEIKFGVLFNRFDQYANQGEGPKGALSFSSVKNFLSGNYKSYTTYTQQGYNSLKDMLFEALGGYVQDNYHVIRHLSLNLGLRYEFETTPNEKNGRQSYFVDPPYSASYTLGPIVNNPTYKDFSPRVGFAWDVFGNGSTSMRGGAAILYDLSNDGEIFGLEGLAMPPYVNSYVVTPKTSGAPSTIQFPFPIPGGASSVGSAPVTINRNYKSPRMYDFNLSVERKLPLNTILSVAYAGSRGLHLWQPQREINPNCPTSNKFVPKGCEGITSVTSGPTQWLNAKAPKLNPSYSNFALFDTEGVSWYNALQVNLTNRLSHSLQYQIAYTFSKLLDDTEGITNADTSNSATGLTMNPFDSMMEWGPANFDLKSNLHASVLYYFPKVGSNGFVGHIVNGWWTGNIVTTQTGQPFSPLIGSDREQAGLNGSKGGLERPSVVTSANLATLQAEALAAGVTTCPAGSTNCVPYNPVVYDPKTVITHNVNQWFNTNMFALQPVGTIGDLRRNTLRDPGLTQWDMSLNKDTSWARLGEDGAVQFRAEMFNVLNHPALGPANNSIFDGSVGDSVETSTPTNITSQSNSSRQIQFSLRVMF